jgi:MFS family permease
VVFAILAAILAGLVTAYWALCVAALLAGGATGTIIIALQRYVGKSAHSATELKTVFSWLGLGPALSNFIGPLTAGFLIDGWGFKAAFLCLACFPLVSWLMVKNAPEQEKKPQLNHLKSSSQQAKPKILDLLANKSLRRLLLVNWFMSACWDVHTFVVPLMGHERHYSATAIGAILGAFAISATTVRVLIPLLASHLKEWKVIFGAMLCTSFFLSCYPFMPNAISMGLCSIALGFVLGSVQPMIMSTLHQVTPHERHGEALGLRMMMVNASSVAMPTFFGFAGALIGASALFGLTAVWVMIGSTQAWALKPKV